MAKDDLQILITGKLNTGLTIGEINNSIKAIEKHPSLKKIKIKAKIDEKILATITKFSKTFEKANKVVENSNKVVKEFITENKKLDGTIETITKKQLKNGEIIERIKIINNEKTKSVVQNANKESKAIEETNREYGKLIKKVELLNAEKNRIKLARTFRDNKGIETTIDTGAGKETTYKIVDNAEKIAKAEEKAQQDISDVSRKLIHDELQERLKSTTQTQRDIEKFILNSNETIADQQNRINKRNTNDYEQMWRNALRTQEINARNVNEQLEHSLNLYRQQAQINVLNAQRRYKGLVDNRELNEYLNRVNNLTTNTPNLKREMDNLSMSFKRIETNAKTAGVAIDTANKSSISFGEALKTAMIKFPIWMAASTAFFGTLRFFTSGINYVNDLNKALTEISIVTNKSQKEVVELGKEYRNLAIQMGVTTKDIASASVEFYRQGLSQEEVMERVKTATQYAKISNLDFIQSSEILTATVNSMNVDIKRASDVFSYLGDATATGKMCAPYYGNMVA